MSVIHLTNFIPAPVERVFDLTRNLEVHKFSMQKYQEKIIGGSYHSLVEKGDTIKWQAKHLRKVRVLESKITDMRPYEYFRDEMTMGDFKTFYHEHYFKPCDNGTIMIDYLHYTLPYGKVGEMFDRLYMKKYLEQLLTERNKVVHDIAASANKWKRYL